jgi:hypothetical protein
MLSKLKILAHHMVFCCVCNTRIKCGPVLLSKCSKYGQLVSWWHQSEEINRSESISIALFIFLPVENFHPQKLVQLWLSMNIVPNELKWFYSTCEGPVNHTMGRSFGWEKLGSCHSRSGTIKIPPCSRACVQSIDLYTATFHQQCCMSPHKCRIPKRDIE